MEEIVHLHVMCLGGFYNMHCTGSIFTKVSLQCLSQEIVCLHVILASGLAAEMWVGATAKQW